MKKAGLMNGSNSSHDMPVEWHERAIDVNWWGLKRVQFTATHYWTSWVRVSRELLLPKKSKRQGFWTIGGPSVGHRCSHTNPQPRNPFPDRKIWI